MKHLVLLAFVFTATAAQAAPIESFGEFIRHFEAKALAAGVSKATYRAATKGLTSDPKVPDLVEKQPEFTTPVWDYMDKRITADRIKRGQAAMAANKALFERVGIATGVDPAILGAIWGMETDYGAVLSSKSLIRPVVRSLATLVWQRRGRLAGDEADLIGALKLIEMNRMAPEALLGSWAGAIGHLQVNPSNVVSHGSDGDGDGVIDLHGSLPDALATSAKFLLDLGYEAGLDWGFEVKVPPGFDYLLADRETLRPIAFFAARGIERVKGRTFATLDTPVFLYAPAGANGPKFLMTRNYLVLKGYNFSDSYAMSVAHLADRLKGGGPYVTNWPRSTRFPDLAQRLAIQKALVGLGLLDGAVDGRLGPKSQAAYARFQARSGEVADGFITLEAYDELVSAPK